ncbi:MAG: SH3 domain-containing protein, partial [Gemmatimonadaceae bacterium]
LGAVPAIPPTPLALVAAACWILAWGMLAWNVARRRASGSRALIAGALGAAIVLGAFAASLDARLAARDLVVVTQDAPLHELPALASDRSTTLRPGEIARVVERQGPWVRVATDGGRHGWAELDDLTSLARD